MRITTTTIAPVIQALREAGLKPVVVGSLAKRGWSSHDADIRVGFWDDGDTVYEDPEDIPGVKKIKAVVKKLGFSNTGGGAFDSRGREEDAGFGSAVETWTRGDIIVDIFPNLVEFKREWEEFDKIAKAKYSVVSGKGSRRKSGAEAGIGGAKL